MYNIKDLRTANMAADRSSDLASFEPTMTQQHEADAADINLIVRKVENGSILNHVNRLQPQFADVSDIVGYQDALEIVNAANSAFMSLDAHVRARFSNDPRKMVDFLTDPNNMEEAVRLGLAEARQEPLKDVPHKSEEKK